MRLRAYKLVARRCPLLEFVTTFIKAHDYIGKGADLHWNKRRKPK